MIDGVLIFCTSPVKGCLFLLDLFNVHEFLRYFSKLVSFLRIFLDMFLTFKFSLSMEELAMCRATSQGGTDDVQRAQVFASLFLLWVQSRTAHNPFCRYSLGVTFLNEFSELMWFLRHWVGIELTMLFWFLPPSSSLFRHHFPRCVGMYKYRQKRC